ncbi:SpoIIE family protein phosphatase [Streptomyces pactum]|uniref:SpoIIE family protein phosphatase n=1 Tax=Streptomyces pactum TaxID=68249 RepID=A0ABS0NF44_9ACTN|nr:SpoIIE family protein phosphatase [Streptomyces pactum]MBH5333818.1 SpoIIE family protein phosphatase [Streptomyces pactum]
MGETGGFPAGPGPAEDGAAGGPDGTAAGPWGAAAGPTGPPGGLDGVAGGPEGAAPPGGLLDLLGVAAVVLDARGRIVLWSPQAERLLGHSAAEALGRPAVRLLVAEDHLDAALTLFDRVMETGESWAGVFPIRLKGGGDRLLELRAMRLTDDLGDPYALGLASDRATLRAVERDLALSVRLVEQSPIGVAVLDNDLRYVTVNPALVALDGISAEGHTGRRAGEVLQSAEARNVERLMRQVLASGEPVLDREVVGRTPAHPDTDHAWSVSLYRLEGADGRVLGLAASVIDVTDRHRAAAQAEQARHRLAVVADASVRIGTTLDLERTARELAEVAVPELGDVAAVDVLDSVLDGRPHQVPSDGPATFRALAVVSAYPTVAVRAADPPGETARYAADRLVTRCVSTARPVIVARTGPEDLTAIARDRHAAGLLAEAGVHSYLAVPLIARGEVLGALDLKRARNPQPFGEDDTLLACELAARAAVSIDNARWYRRQHDIALTLQRSMLPEPPRGRPWLDVAARYQPAGAGSEVGGDWFDVIHLPGERTALVVGDVMGSGVNAATTMGRLRIATRTLTMLGLDPADVLARLDEITSGLDPYFATCVYAVHDARRGQCCTATAGHLPPAVVRADGTPRLLDLPAGAPLGAGGPAYRAVTVPLDPGDRLVLYTDGLVETRTDDIDDRLRLLLDLLRPADPSLEATCDRLLRTLRHPENHDDVALLIAAPS